MPQPRLLGAGRSSLRANVTRYHGVSHDMHVTPRATRELRTFLPHASSLFRPSANSRGNNLGSKSSYPWSSD